MTTSTDVPQTQTRLRAELDVLTAKATQRPLPLRCRPPGHRATFDYGDVVPLGFLAMALHDTPQYPTVRQLLTQRRQGKLWAYHRDTLVTCTDSALVLQGYPDQDGVLALEDFADDGGGYRPQRCAEQPSPGVMQITPYNRHWCRPDYATTALVHALRSAHGLPTKPATSTFLTAGFDRRSGLYFANPYLVDWLLARSFSTVPSAPLARRLAAEVLASRNDDGTFGRYDIAFSTSLAVLTLTELGVTDDRVARAQQALAELIDSGGISPTATPFYSTTILAQENFSPEYLLRMAFGETTAQFIWVGGQVHAASLYLDEHHMIATSLAALALAPRLGGPSPHETSHEQHPRYASPTPLDYVRQHALPPYLTNLS